MYRSKYRNLIIIGNGFDRWQGLPSSYDNFRKYYESHIDEAMDLLGIRRETITGPGGAARAVTPVELVYGDPFHPAELPAEFFWNFEVSLDKIDDQQLNMFYGRSEKGISALKESVEQAQAILRSLFSSWILDLDVAFENGREHFRNDCFFINFNYTDTLEKRFSVNKKDIYHIHGEAERPESIIFGHATHPETAFKELIEQRFITPLTGKGRLPRFEGLYAIEDVLYRTDKHVADNIDSMCKVFMDRGVHMQDIENVYVLGHSFGSPDVEYFNYIDKTTRCGCDFDSFSAAGKLDKRKLAQIVATDEEKGEEHLLAEIERNILYAVHHRERSLGKAPVPFPELEKMEREFFGTDQLYDDRTAKEAKWSVHQRFLLEQAGRTRKLLEKTAKERGLGEVPRGCHSVLGFWDYLDGGHMPRKRNAQWHISCFTPDDKKQIQRVMKQIGLKRYQLYGSIDECMAACLRNDV